MLGLIDFFKQKIAAQKPPIPLTPVPDTFAEPDGRVLLDSDQWRVVETETSIWFWQKPTVTEPGVRGRGWNAIFGKSKSHDLRNSRTAYLCDMELAQTDAERNEFTRRIYFEHDCWGVLIEAYDPELGIKVRKKREFINRNID